MKKFIITAGALVALVVPSAAMAAQPNDPGCFGQDRADWIHAHSGQEWGAIAKVRAGDNGDINATYKAENCS